MAVVPVTVSFCSEVSVITTGAVAVPEAEPAVVTLSVSKPANVTPPVAPFKAKFTESAAPEVIAVAKPTVVAPEAAVTATSTMAGKLETTTSDVEPAFVTLATPVMPAASRVKVPTVAVAEMFSIKEEVTPAPSVAAAVVEMLNVSVPAPPFNTSPAVNVVPEAVNVSSPAPVVLRSTLESSVIADAGVRDETAAYVPPVLPLVCDAACDASTLVLNVATDAP